MVAAVSTGVEPAAGLGAKSDSELWAVAPASSVLERFAFRGRRSFFGLGVFDSVGPTSIGTAVAAGTVSVLVEAAGTIGVEGAGEAVGAVVLLESGAAVDFAGAVVEDVGAEFVPLSSFQRESSEPSDSTAMAGAQPSHSGDTGPKLHAKSITLAATLIAVFRTKISFIF